MGSADNPDAFRVCYRAPCAGVRVGAHEYETVASSSKGQRLKALREGGGAALTRLRRFSSSADGLAEDYAALVEEMVTRLGELEPVKTST